MRLGFTLGFLCGPMLAGTFLSSASFAQFVSAVEPVTKLISLGRAYEAMAWSRDGKYFLLAERMLTDGRTHFCVYKTETLKKVRCVAALPKDEEIYVGGLDWIGDRLYFEAGYIEQPRVGWIDIRGWQEASFKEIDASTKWEFVQGMYGRCPAWDEVEKGLFFSSTVEFGGVLFEKNKVKTVRLKTGICAGFDERYIWYTEYGQQAAGLRRLHRATGKVDIITEGGEFADSPFSVSEKGQVLFVRNKVNVPTSRHVVYGYSTSTRIVGPLFGDKLPVGEEVQAVAINKAGDRALVSVIDKKNSQIGKNAHTILMLTLTGE